MEIEPKTEQQRAPLAAATKTRKTAKFPAHFAFVATPKNIQLLVAQKVAGNLSLVCSNIPPKDKKQLNAKKDRNKQTDRQTN